MTQPEITSDTTFFVDRLGNVKTPKSRTPQIVIHREQLSPQQRAVRIDFDKVAVSSDQAAVYVVLMDFGLPFRTITIHQTLVMETEGGGNKLVVTCPSLGWNETTIRIDGRSFDERGVKLEEGQRVVFAHDGQPADYRTGFIQNDAYIVAFTDNWRKPGEEGHYGHYTPIVELTYVNRGLTITTYDEAHAEVIFEKIVSQADVTLTTPPALEMLGEDAYLEVTESLQRVLPPDQFKTVTGLVTGLQSLGRENKSLREQVEGGRIHEQALEVALARNKNLLNETQGRLQAALHENEQLRRKAGGTSKEGFTTFRAEASGAGVDPLGYCGVLGVNPERLFGMHPDEAQKVVSALRNVYSRLYHPDINRNIDPQIMKDINNAADRVITRIKTGHWGRN